ncbi:hypothetical protein XBLMG947_3376 [Xanthomonas bromi]|uniref:Uncharacterized protein n=1 Tax=Xanthomonas bromi TaxID=56449 RepID=A0A1C3NQ97_9XANT|nr:hypothetical protein XBLMG947_3376 [Xanthomonas bromi]
MCLLLRGKLDATLLQGAREPLKHELVLQGQRVCGFLHWI